MGEKRLYHSVAQQIQKMIREGAFPVGSRLPAERILAEQLNVSRVTVREAQIALESLGMLDIRVGSGVYILRDISNVKSMPDVSAFELTEARSAFESEAAALAASAITDAELDEIDALVEQMESESVPHENWAQDADQEFHLAIARATKNNAIVETVERLWLIRKEQPEIRKVYDSILGIETNARLNEHRNIAIALRSRNPQEARKAMRSHFQRVLEVMLNTAEAKAIEEARRNSEESRVRFLKQVIAD